MKRLVRRVAAGAAILLGGAVAAFCDPPGSVSAVIAQVSSDLVSEGLAVLVAVAGVVVLAIAAGMGLRLLRRVARVG